MIRTIRIADNTLETADNRRGSARSQPVLSGTPAARRLLLLAAGLVLLVPAGAAAQPVPSREGTCTHVFPAGGRRGTTVRVRVGTECLPPQTSLHVWGGGVSAPAVLGDEARSGLEPSPRRKPTEIPIHYPREWNSEFTIDGDAPLGPVFWRLSTAGGGTCARPFLVGELPEFIETESNSVPERAEAVTLPVTINGRIAGERDADYFRFTLEHGQRVVCEVAAARLGSPLDPLVEIQGPHGNRIDCALARAGSDPVLAFTCEQQGEHRMRIAHVGFHGGPSYVYRITLSDRPFTALAWPAGGQAGQELDLHLFQLDGRASGRAGGLSEVIERVRIPTDAAGLFVHPATGGARGPVLLVAGAEPETVEVDAHAGPATAQRLTLPIVVHGRFLTATDEDWYEFRAQRDELLEFDCRPTPGSSSVPVFELMAAPADRADAAHAASPGTVPEQQRLARVSSVDAQPRQARLDWKTPADGVYRVRLTDLRHGSRGGELFAYRLLIRQAVPDFTLRLPVDFVNIAPGAKESLNLSVARRGGFSSPIDLTIEGLPESVKPAATQIPAGAASFKLTLAADGAAPHSSGALRIVGRATQGDRVVTQVARALHAGVDAEGCSIGPPDLDQVYLTVMHKPLFRLYCSEAYEYATRGTIYPYRMDVERLNGFDGEIILQRGDRQNRDLDGIEMLDCRVPPGETRPIMPLYLPETMHINIQSQSQLYTQAYALFRDEAGRPQSLLVVSEKRNMLRTLPTVVKVLAAEPELPMAPGRPAICRVQLQRTSNFDGAMRLTLVDAPGFTADPAEIRAGETAGEIRIRMTDGAAAASAAADPPEIPELTIRARGQMPGGVPVLSECRVKLSLDSPTERTGN